MQSSSSISLNVLVYFSLNLLDYFSISQLVYFSLNLLVPLTCLSISLLTLCLPAVYLRRLQWFSLSDSQSGADCLELRLRVKWRVNTGKCVDASPLVTRGNDSSGPVVYVGSHSGWVVAVELVSGSERWRVRLGGRVESSACLSLCGRFVIMGESCSLLWTSEPLLQLALSLPLSSVCSCDIPATSSL